MPGVSDTEQMPSRNSKSDQNIDKNRKTGRVDAIWPGSALHYRVALEEPRWEDMEIKYHGPVGLLTVSNYFRLADSRAAEPIPIPRIWLLSCGSEHRS